MNSTFPLQPSPARAAFTLVEVCLSLGIVALTVMPLLGLFSSGLDNLRSTIDTGQGRTVSQSVLIEARQMPFDALIEADYWRYFTQEGDPVKADDPGVIYSVHLTSNAATVLPGASETFPTLLTVNVTVYKNYLKNKRTVATAVAMVGRRALIPLPSEI